jgi:3-hydroxyacyl-CoA dehydrogenase
MRRRLGLLKPDDVVVMHAHELLHVACAATRGPWPTARWRPPRCRRANIKVAGRSGIATLEMMLVNMREGGMISAHDYRVAKAPRRGAVRRRDRNRITGERAVAARSRARFSSNC